MVPATPQKWTATLPLAEVYESLPAVTFTNEDAHEVAIPIRHGR